MCRCQRPNTEKPKALSRTSVAVQLPLLPQTKLFHCPWVNGQRIYRVLTPLKPKRAVRANTIWFAMSWGLFCLHYFHLINPHNDHMEFILLMGQMMHKEVVFQGHILWGALAVPYQYTKLLSPEQFQSCWTPTMNYELLLALTCHSVFICSSKLFPQWHWERELIPQWY